jgi:hypothetical protein
MIQKAQVIWYAIVLLQAVLLILPLLAVICSTNADATGQITTGAVIHFGDDPTTQYVKVM